MANPGSPKLVQALQRGPVMVEMNPLALLCLPPEVDVVFDVEAVVERLDALTPHSEQPVLIPRIEARYRHRFEVLTEQVGFTPEALDQRLPLRIEDARRWLLTHRQLADRIVHDAAQHRYQVLALLLIDGLSYEDVRDWPEAPAACLVDGPSITYARKPQGDMVPEVGFPGIVGTPPLARRLVDVGIPHSIGFSYWQREHNDVSAHLFQGVPLTRVQGITAALDALSRQSLSCTYVQLVREGLDGLAHGRREVTKAEIGGTVNAVHEDYHRLIEVVANTGLPGAVYLTADHGILWKTHHPDLCQIEALRSDHPRYQTGGNIPSEYGMEFHLGNEIYTSYRHPYLGTAVRANDSGVHGGLSYWESLVPFVRVEVNI